MCEPLLTPTFSIHFFELLSIISFQAMNKTSENTTVQEGSMSSPFTSWGDPTSKDSKNAKKKQKKKKTKASYDETDLKDNTKDDCWSITFKNISKVLFFNELGFGEFPYCAFLDLPGGPIN